MFKRSSDLHVACSPTQAFRHIALEFFTNHPRWDPDLVEVTKVSSGPIGVGTIGREVRDSNGRRFISQFRVSRFQPVSAWELRQTTDHNQALKPALRGLLDQVAEVPSGSRLRFEPTATSV